MITVKQTFRLYEVVNKYFQNSEDSKILVEETEDIMDNRIRLNLTDFATKSDLIEVKSELKLEISELRVEMAQGFKEILKWIIILMASYMSITIAIIKLL